MTPDGPFNTQGSMRTSPREQVERLPIPRYASVRDKARPNSGARHDPMSGLKGLPLHILVFRPVGCPRISGMLHADCNLA